MTLSTALVFLFAADVYADSGLADTPGPSTAYPSVIATQRCKSSRATCMVRLANIARPRVCARSGRGKHTWYAPHGDGVKRKRSTYCTAPR